MQLSALDEARQLSYVALTDSADTTECQESLRFRSNFADLYSSTSKMHLAIMTISNCNRTAEAILANNL